MQTFEEIEKHNIKLDVYKFNNLQIKIDLTLNFIRDYLEKSKNPICLCSFGKDSLVMLHLILRIEKIPIVYWREPYFQSKFRYPQTIAELWDLEVYDYPPSFVDYIQLDDYFDIFNFYSIDKNQYIVGYTGTRNYKSDDKKILCAIKDLLNRPKIPEYQFKWDLIFHGHKQCDPVYITDRMEVPTVNDLGNKKIVMPIRDWTNEEIWEYIEKYELPYNKKRYDDIDEDFNNDLFPTCHNCLDYMNIGKKVFCPKIKQEIDCIAKTKENNIQLRDYLLNKIYK